MKYDKELYIDSGFYEGDEDIQNYKEKIVKCRKPHKCMGGCDKTINIGEQAVNESGFLDGHPVSSYTCLECIEKWLEESGQIGDDEKIKVTYAKIVVGGLASRPYYSIEYQEIENKDVCIGFGSYDIKFVLEWIAECFEFVHLFSNKQLIEKEKENDIL